MNKVQQQYKETFQAIEEWQRTVNEFNIYLAELESRPKIVDKIQKNKDVFSIMKTEMIRDSNKEGHINGLAVSQLFDVLNDSKTIKVTTVKELKPGQTKDEPYPAYLHNVILHDVDEFLYKFTHELYRNPPIRYPHPANPNYNTAVRKSVRWIYDITKESNTALKGNSINDCFGVWLELIISSYVYDCKLYSHNYRKYERQSWLIKSV